MGGNLLNKLTFKFLVTGCKASLHGPRENFVKSPFLKDFPCAYSVDLTK